MMVQTISLQVTHYSKVRLVEPTSLFRRGFGFLLRMIRERLWPLDEDTIVHPGHGPLTTIGEEKATNPFLNDNFRGRGAWL